MNFSSTAQNVRLPGAYREVPSGRDLSGIARVPARTLLILQET